MGRLAQGVSMARFGIEHVTFQIELRPLYQLAK